jgi:hypothetical protein
MRNILYRFTFGGILRWSLFLGISGTLLWYGAFQARLLIAGPSITLRPDTTVLHDTRVTTINGIAENITMITLNDRPIFTDDAGNFHEQLVLENGYTIMTLRAEDRYGRKKVLEQPFVYEPAYASSDRTP